jgi:molybdenum cofactor guanylyltransferase
METVDSPVRDAAASLEGSRGNADVTGAILAGGRARRMGGEDKGFVVLNGRPMIQYIVDALRPQVGALIVSANRNQARYAALCECPVVPDTLGEFAGPLAGMASVLRAAATAYVLAVPCDSPLVPPDLAERLLQGLLAADAELSVAHDGERLQPVFALLRRDLLSSIEAYLQAGERKIDLWYARHRMVPVDLSNAPETFINVNTPEDKTALERRLAATPLR